MTKTIFDIKKVAYATFWWENQEGSKKMSRPSQPTVRGLEIDQGGYASPHKDYPFETLIERAKRLDILDVWTPHLILQFANTHQLHYQGIKAEDLWKTWNAHIFSKSKQKK